MWHPPGHIGDDRPGCPNRVEEVLRQGIQAGEAQITTCKGHFKPGDISPCKRDSREAARKHPVSCNSEEDEEANQTDQIQLAAGRSANFPPRRARAALEGLVGIAACRDSLRGDMSAMLTVSARHSASGKGTTSCLCGHTVNREKPESVVWLSRPATYVAIKNVVGLCRTELNLVGCVSPLDARYASPFARKSAETGLIS